MTPDELIPERIASWHLQQPERGLRSLRDMLGLLGPERLDAFLPALDRLLPRQADPDMALLSLERFLAACPDDARKSALLEVQARGLEMLLQIFSTSRFFSDLLIRSPEDAEILYTPVRRSPTPDELTTALRNELADCRDDATVLRTIRRFRQRQMLRIGANDILRDRSLEEVTGDLSGVAQAAIQNALEVALKNISGRFGHPQTLQNAPARCAVLAFGKLGGEELNYSSDIDLMVFYDEEGETTGRRSPIGNDEFFSRVVSELIRLLSAYTDRGQAYRVDMRLRPEGNTGPLARSLGSTLSYYDTLGRTWERQALIKVRPVAGDPELGRDFMRSIEPFVYRKYLSFAEINEIKALKRRIEKNTQKAGRSETDVKTGSGGIRDIEFVIQFLQLLNGGDLPELRRRNTLDAMQFLAAKGCLSDPEYRALDDTYRFLRRTEHRLQILFDWQTHQLPSDEDELRKLAVRMGYVISRPPPIPMPIPTTPGTLSPQKFSPLDEVAAGPMLDTRNLLVDPLELFLHDYQLKTRLNRTILDHLLHQAFADSGDQAAPETDLILAPDPDEATIRNTLSRFRFREIPAAFRNLMALAREAPFLSARRCRHFLAAIAPQLLQAIAETPDPDATLIHLEQVTASLGAKAVLWELFSFNPPCLKLYVDICSGNPFLSQILINNPGMIDELLDSLVLNQPRTIHELQTELTELFRGVEKPEVTETILHSFQDKEWLRIGVRDQLALESIRDTTQALSDLAETILCQTVQRVETLLFRRISVPILRTGPRAGQPSRYAIIGLGKLGGRELSYHSDLDIVLIYEGAGEVGPDGPDECFTELARLLIRSLSQPGPMGRLYNVDMKLRPTGKSGSLVVALIDFLRYFEDGEAGVWERMSMTRARVLWGDPGFTIEMNRVLKLAMFGPGWSPEWLDAILSMRQKLESKASTRNLKRGFGGLVDVEFLVQTLQLKYGRRFPQIVVVNTLEGLTRLRNANLLPEEDFVSLRDSFTFQREIESRLRMGANRAINDYPESPEELQKLAERLKEKEVIAFLHKLDAARRLTRSIFLRVMEAERFRTS